jgi:hypothetical protein
VSADTKRPGSASYSLHLGIDQGGHLKLFYAKSVLVFGPVNKKKSAFFSLAAPTRKLQSSDTAVPNQELPRQE